MGALITDWAREQLAGAVPSGAAPQHIWPLHAPDLVLVVAGLDSFERVSAL
jgi:hypothetical protein